MSFFSELKRRNVFKVGAAYAVIAWLLIQVVDTVLPRFGAPDWVVTTLMLLVILGFPVSLILAWAFEMTSEGIRPTSPEEGGTYAGDSSQNFNSILTLALLIVVVFMIVDNYLLTDSAPSEEASTVTVIASEEFAAAMETSVTQRPNVLPDSVAVLSCNNFSTREEDAYIAPSLHEEILNQLNKLSSLNVIARASVMQYVGTTMSVTEIAQDLNVETVMECSVAFGDGRLVISTQLQDGDTGLNIWSERYNREFAGVFDILSDIAVNVAGALAVELTDEDQRVIDDIPTTSTEAYALFLRAQEIVGSGNASGGEEFLLRALEYDPDFAEAHMGLAITYTASAFNTSGGNAVSEEERIDHSVQAAFHALRAAELDPQFSILPLSIGNVITWKWSESLPLLRNTEGSNQGVVVLLSAVGDAELAITKARRSALLNPKSFGERWSLANALNYGNYYSEAADVMREAIEINPRNPSGHFWLAFCEIGAGNYEEAEALLRLGEDLMGDNRVIAFLAEIAYAYSRIGLVEDVQRLVDEAAAQPDVDFGNGGRAMLALAVGDRVEAIRNLEAALDNVRNNRIDISFWNLMNLKLNFMNDPVLEEPEFAAIRDQIRGN